MSCPHSRIGTPETCSQCLGARARVVSPDATTIDGKPTGRESDPVIDQQRIDYARRGGRAKARRPAP